MIPTTLLAALALALPPGDEPKKDAWDVAADHGPAADVEFTVREGTWMNLDVSPDGREIVFDLLGDLYALPIEGGEARLLSGGPPYEVQPRFSPDGKRIAFTSDRGGADNLWVLDQDGGNRRAVTKETFRLLNNPCWTPDGEFLVARKHFTSTRSLGAGEMWIFPLAGGSPGLPLTSKRNDQQDAGEPELSPDGKYLWFSEDVSPGGGFEYNRDPHGVIYAIQRLDLETGERRTMLRGAGGSCRPALSPDGRTLAFVRRIGPKTALFLSDLETGRERLLWDGLSKDSQETWSIFGVYPNFAWTPDARSLVIWAQGKLQRVDASTGAASEIPFTARVRQRVAEALRFPQRPGAPEFRARVCRWPTVTPDGATVVWQALGHLRAKRLPDGEPRRVTDAGDLEFCPTLSPDGTLVAWTTWNDVEGGHVRVAGLDGRGARAVTDRPGHYLNPSFSPDGRWLAFERDDGDGQRGRLFTQDPGIWRVALDGGRPVRVCERGSRPRFDGTGTRLLLHDQEGENAALVSVSLEGQDRRVIAQSKYATEFALSPDGRHLAFTELFQAYVARLPRTGRAVTVSAETKDLPVRRLSKDAGEFLSFSPDGARVYHSLGPTLTEHLVADLFREGELPARTHDLGFAARADVPETDLWLTGARVVTLRDDEVLEDAAIHVKGNRIVDVGRGLAVPPGARAIDCAGKTIVPGFVDVHAHMGQGSGGMSPRQNWPYLANLAFGVTTTHDPSNDTKSVFAMSELVRAGLVLGPRVYSTGTILYGAEGSFKAVINSLDDARSHLRRLQAFGAFTVKSYNQPRREQRQQVLQAARELEIMVVPEGGSMLFHNLSMVLDGHTTIEHAIPVAPLHADARQLWAKSRTAYTPTLVVGYGGLWGENWWYQHTDVFRHERLLRFVPRDVVFPRARRRVQAPEEEFHHLALARTATELARAGVNVQIGAHGQMQGLGAHWETWMLGQGGMTPLEALRAASLSGARALGLDGELGSLEPGKLADLVVLDRNPLEELRNTDSVRLVMINGRLLDAATLDQIAPVERKCPPTPPLLLGASPAHADCAEHSKN
jgi:imidazolonepropionase-like amidohydrolase/Tol biopolymer transport system component